VTVEALLSKEIVRRKGDPFANDEGVVRISTTSACAGSTVKIATIASAKICKSARLGVGNMRLKSKAEGWCSEM